MAGGVPLEVWNQRVPQRAQGGAAVTGVGRWQMEGNLSVQHWTALGTGDEEFLQDPRRFCAPFPRGIGHAPCRLIGFRSCSVLSGVAENAAPVELLEEPVKPLPIGRVHGAFLPVVAHQDDPARDNKFKGIESVEHIIGQHRSVGQPAAEQVNPRTVVKLESEVCQVVGAGQLSRPVCRGRGVSGPKVARGVRSQEPKRAGITGWRVIPPEEFACGYPQFTLHDVVDHCIEGEVGRRVHLFEELCVA